VRTISERTISAGGSLFERVHGSESNEASSSVVENSEYSGFSSLSTPAYCVCVVVRDGRIPNQIPNGGLRRCRAIHTAVRKVRFVDDGGGAGLADTYFYIYRRITQELASSERERRRERA
jgi:hypothetical protein